MYILVLPFCLTYIGISVLHERKWNKNAKPQSTEHISPEATTRGAVVRTSFGGKFMWFGSLCCKNNVPSKWGKVQRPVFHRRIIVLARHRPTPSSNERRAKQKSTTGRFACPEICAKAHAHHVEGVRQSMRTLNSCNPLPTSWKASVDLWHFEIRVFTRFTSCHELLLAITSLG